MKSGVMSNWSWMKLERDIAEDQGVYLIAEGAGMGTEAQCSKT